MLQHHMDEPPNYWVFGGLIFTVLFILHYAFFGDVRVAALISIALAGAVVCVHYSLNQSVRKHNRL